jgi:hypothetical protein
MRTFLVGVILVMAGCGGESGLRQCLPDEAGCAADADCCGSADLRGITPDTYTVTGGTCFAGRCCTSYVSPGWRCVVCGGQPTCWQTAPTPPPDFAGIPHCSAQLSPDGGQGPTVCDGGQ